MLRWTCSSAYIASKSSFHNCRRQRQSVYAFKGRAVDGEFRQAGDNENVEVRFGGELRGVNVKESCERV